MSPERSSWTVPIRSAKPGGVPATPWKLAGPLKTVYVPLPVGAPVGPNVCQVPPPPRARALNRDARERERKVPEPVSLIDEPSLANAESCPPALIAMGVVQLNWTL